MSNSIYILDDNLLASSGARFLNYIIDVISFVVLFFLIIMFLGVLIGLFELTGLGAWLDNLGDLGWNIIGIIILMSYYLMTEGLLGRSLGKFITGTVVVDENGEKPDFGTILKRSLCRLIPFDAFSFLGSRGWHDSMSDTYVVDKKALDESVKMFHELKLIGIEAE
ncbi:RDD family protein [Flavobacterium sp. MC2016-06]|uniref:RDD family protein n=1 Tax=Flavobacterium sp. MC2016-06 TaxID=2676308 RepID=UPI0012BAC803|nr:RDD family protein [Flavobacterium sp. MC2016-06]MBU3858054.1 RDD family protein [Flavobacterium sp. MC2016-06]